MSSRFETYESIYWVFTHRCNDRCAHCYNNSNPQGEILPLEDCLAIVANLPARLGRLILSGGEPLTEERKLHAILDALADKYGGATQIMLQTNGDLLTADRLDALLARGVTRIDVASMDQFHKHQGRRRETLEALFRWRGMCDDAPDPLIERESYLKPGVVSYGFWGANQEFWLGGNWARGQAYANDIWLRDGSHNFCTILSGARGFLGGTDLPQELSIQLWMVSPCCAGMKNPVGDARRERIASVLDRLATSPIFQALNAGDPYGMGQSLGVDTAYARTRAQELENVCLWCDEFFEEHAGENGGGRVRRDIAVGAARRPTPAPSTVRFDA